MLAAARRPAVLLALFAIALRCLDWGNPVIHVDEQYYLLVGDRMLAGAVPYLDIWDRKPIGLFLLFAGFRLFPGDGILAYQLAATVAAWATATVVAAGARTLGAATRGQLAAGALYLLGLSLLGGRGGQAPVFYNLLVAAAGLLAIRAGGRTPRAILISGAAACLLVGIAIQMKYTPAVEGAFIGLAHAVALRRRGASWPALAAAMGLWALLGLLPTLAAIAWYWHAGALGPFWFANFTSIARRPGYPLAEWSARLLGLLLQLSPLIACAAYAWRVRPREPAMRVAAGWLLAAGAGFAAIGTFFDHYALPLLAPLAIVAAPLLGRRPHVALGVLALWLALVAVGRWRAPDDRASARAVAASVARYAGHGCPYVYNGDTATYLLARACLPTAYAFPNLLAYTTERGATGIDEAAEVARILRTRPPAIVTSDRAFRIWNPATKPLVDAALARDYALILRVPRAGWHSLVYARRDLLVSAPAAPPSAATRQARPAR